MKGKVRVNSVDGQSVSLTVWRTAEEPSHELDGLVAGKWYDLEATETATPTIKVAPVPSPAPEPVPSEVPIVPAPEV